MKYAKGNIGRVFVVRFEHGDDLHAGLAKLADDESIQFASITLVGALGKGDMVVGPKKAEFPVEPSWTSFDDGREVIAFGTISRHKGEASMHIHGVLGRGKRTLAGCLRKGCETFITIEAFVTEITGVSVKREKDGYTGFDLLSF